MMIQGHTGRACKLCTPATPVTARCACTRTPRVAVSAAGRGEGASGGGKPSAKGRGGGKQQQGFWPASPKTTPKQTGAAHNHDCHVSLPIAVELQDELTNTESAETPRWDTFCNHVGGEWVGQYGAYTPWEAKPEPVWKDDKGKNMEWVFSRCIEYSGQLDSAEDEAAGDDSEEARSSGTEMEKKSLREIALTGGSDEALLRRLTRATTAEQLSAITLLPLEGAALYQQQPADESEGPSTSNENVDVEALSNNSNGVVFFNGGIYSAGPDFIGPPNYKILQDLGPSTSEGSSSNEESVENSAEEASGSGREEEDAMTAAPGSISILESCLVDWASKTRMRLKVTVRITHSPVNGEVEVEILRILLFREFWVGTVGSSAAEVAATVEETGMSKTPCTDLPRPSRNALHGSWAVFTTSALAIEDQNPFTGEPTVTWVYMTNEDRQLWNVPRGPPTEEDEDSGAALWLPGGVVASFRMVDVSAEEGEDSEEEAAQSSRRQGSEGDTQPARGFSFGFSWCLPSGSGAGAALQVASVDRDYDGAGVLRGVRTSTAVKGGWSGGKM